jgi:hypothetical protein
MVALVRIQPAIQFFALLVREGQGGLIIRNAVPQILDQSDPLLEGQLAQARVHVGILTIRIDPAHWVPDA